MPSMISPRRYKGNNDLTIVSVRLQRRNSLILYSNKKVDEEWIAFLKQQKENKDNDDSSVNGYDAGNRLGMRDRMKKWLSFKKSRAVDSNANMTPVPPVTMAQPTKLHPEDEQEQVLEEEGIDKMRSLRAEKNRQRQERTQENIEYSWSLDAAVKEGEQVLTECKFLDNLLDSENENSQNKKVDNMKRLQMAWRKKQNALKKGHGMQNRYEHESFTKS